VFRPREPTISGVGEIGRSYPNVPFKTYQEAFDYLNRAEWNLKVGEANSPWNLWAGDTHMFRADSKEELEAFVMGIALTFSMIGPESRGLEQGQ
jgi:hypothetical protein